MKQLTFLSKFFFLFLAISFVSSCDETPTGPTLPPVIELQSGVDLITGATTVDANATFQVRVIADKGDNNMTTFTVLEDGIALDASRINYVGVGQLDNPYTLTTGEQTTFDTNIEITAHDSGTRSYSFRITDSAGETDETAVEISIVSTPLSLAFETANGGVSSDLTVGGMTNFKVELIATKGGSPLSTFSVLEDGVEVDISRVRFNTDNDFATGVYMEANPIDLINDETDGFNWFVWVDSHADGAKTYTFKIEDDAGNTEELSFVITVNSLVELTGKLLSNADGPNNGGMNLLTGESTPAASADAHIRDQGIDLALPTASNWRQQIASVNGASMSIPAVDFPAFDDVASASEIETGFNNGTAVSETGALNINDQFIVLLATGEYVLVRVTNISVTATNNEDEYDLSIKY